MISVVTGSASDALPVEASPPRKTTGSAVATATSGSLRVGEVEDAALARSGAEVGVEIGRGGLLEDDRGPLDAALADRRAVDDREVEPLAPRERPRRGRPGAGAVRLGGRGRSGRGSPGQRVADRR